MFESRVVLVGPESEIKIATPLVRTINMWYCLNGKYLIGKYLILAFVSYGVANHSVHATVAIDSNTVKLISVSHFVVMSVQTCREIVCVPRLSCRTGVQDSNLFVQVVTSWCSHSFHIPTCSRNGGVAKYLINATVAIDSNTVKSISASQFVVMFLWACRHTVTISLVPSIQLSRTDTRASFDFSLERCLFAKCFLLSDFIFRFSPVPPYCN